MTTPEPAQGRTPKDLPSAAVFLGLGFSIACTVGAFVALGVWLDGVLHTSPLCLVLGLLLGCAAAAASTVVLVRRYL